VSDGASGRKGKESRAGGWRERPMGSRWIDLKAVYSPQTAGLGSIFENNMRMMGKRRHDDAI